MLTIQPATTEADFRRCQDILIEVWDLEDGGHRNIIPVRLFQVTQEYSGVVLAARLANSEIVGFAWAFPAIDSDGKQFLFSDTLAVLAQHRDRGIGTQLKLAQRQWALEHNFSKMRWTFDPLEARNAYINIARLGCLTSTYHRNKYGFGTSGPNKGLETDRLTVDWHLNNLRVLRCLSSSPKPGPLPPLHHCIELRRRDGEVVCHQLRLSYNQPELLVALPINFQRLKEGDKAVARDWRLAMRSVCETYFARGYAIVNLHVEHQGAERQCYYRLSLNYATSCDQAVRPMKL
jgi:predicted GNAT superfamily acetyltransferase